MKNLFSTTTWNAVQNVQSGLFNLRYRALQDALVVRGVTKFLDKTVLWIAQAFDLVEICHCEDDVQLHAAGVGAAVYMHYKLPSVEDMVERREKLQEIMSGTNEVSTRQDVGFTRVGVEEVMCEECRIS